MSTYTTLAIAYNGKGNWWEDPDLEGFDPNGLTEDDRQSRRAWALYQALDVHQEVERSEVTLGVLPDGRWAGGRAGPIPGMYWIALEMRYDDQGRPIDRTRVIREGYERPFTMSHEKRISLALTTAGHDPRDSAWAYLMQWAKDCDQARRQEAEEREARWQAQETKKADSDLST